MRVLVAVLALCGCEMVVSPQPFGLTGVDPPDWVIGRFTDAVVHGYDLHLDLKANVQADRVAGGSFRGSVGGIPLPRVTWRSNNELQVTPPPELGEGTYDLTIESRDGRRATLENAVRVVYFAGELDEWSDMGSSVPALPGVETSASGGGISNSVESAAMPALVIDAENHPYVAWSETSGAESYIYVAYHDGSAWVGLDGSLTGTGVSGPGQAQWPTLLLFQRDLLLLAYQYRASESDAWEIHVRRYNGTVWGLQGSLTNSRVSTGTSSCERPTLALDDTKPVVAWQESGGIYAVSYGGGQQWQGGLVPASSTGQNPVLASHATAGIYLAFDASDGAARQIRVAWWTGSAWVGVNGSMQVEGVSNTPGDSTNPTVAIEGQSGLAVVAWQDDSLSGGTEIFARRSVGGAWQPIAQSAPTDFGQTTGGISDIAGDSVLPSLAEAGDVANTLVVVWQQGTRILSRSINDHMSSWEAAQGTYDSIVFPGTEPVSTPRVAANPWGRPTVVWANGQPGASQIYLARRICHITWEEIVIGATDAVSRAGSCSESPSVALFSDRHPAVAWHQAPMPFSALDDWQIHLREFESGAWTEISGSDDRGGISDAVGAGHPSLKIDDNDIPWVAYSHYFSGWRWEVFVARQFGMSWGGVDGSATDPGLSNWSLPSLYPSLALDATTGQPIVAWQNFVDGTTNELRASYHDVHTDNWPSLGDPSGGPHPWFVSLAIDSTGDPVIAWHDASTWSVHVRHWHTDTWVGMGGGPSQVNPGAGRASSAKLVLNDSDEPLVVWQDTTWGNREIYLGAWSAITGDWHQLSGSWTDGGISDTPGDSVEPALVLDHEQNPVVAWAERTSGNSWEILVVRHTGSSWEPITADANVSNTLGSSRQPSLDFVDHRLCVAWTESGLDGNEIALRCVDL